MLNIVAASGLEAAALALSEELSLKLDSDVSSALCLSLSTEGLSLIEPSVSPKGIRVDFVSGAANHRRLYGGGKSQLISKAVGLNKTFKPSILDVTAGLGGDAFVFASLGAKVTMCERNAVVYALLRDGFLRAQKASESLPDLANVIHRMSLINSDGLKLLTESDANSHEIIYLDPMFPPRDKSAAVKKEMSILHRLLGQQGDADSLLEPALAAAKYRVVVKRPSHAPHLAGANPSLSLKGKSTRFDIYSLKKLPS